MVGTLPDFISPGMYSLKNDIARLLLGNTFHVARPELEDEARFPGVDAYTCDAHLEWKTVCLIEVS